jgi:hypothetical protein
MNKYIRDLTESGDYYSATSEKWAAYHKAWNENDMATVMYFEEGNDDDFFYDPEND